MIKRVSKFLLYTLFFFATLIYFLPKENLYYKGEELLESKKVIVSNEILDDRGFSFEISGADIYAMDGIKVANVKSLNIALFLLYNKIYAEGIELTSVASKFVPTHIDHISIVYSVFDPLHINAEAVGDFGEAKAVVDLQQRVAEVKLEPSKLLKTRFTSTMRMLKKSKTGEYIYEQRF